MFCVIAVFLTKKRLTHNHTQCFLQPSRKKIRLRKSREGVKVWGRGQVQRWRVESQTKRRLIDQRNSEGTNEEENKKSSTKGDSKKTFKTAWVGETAKTVSMNSHLLLL